MTPCDIDTFTDVYLTNLYGQTDELHYKKVARFR